MAASARLVVQMTPKEKKALETRAKRAGISTAEFVRRRVTADDLDDIARTFEGLLATLEASAPAILRAVDAAIATASSLIAEPDENRAQARHDFGERVLAGLKTIVLIEERTTALAELLKESRQR